jgi:hypothetical protein
MIGLTLFYLLLFPTGRLPSRRWRWLAWLTVAFVVVGVVLSAFSAGALMGALGPIRNPLGIEGFTSVYKVLLYTISPLLHGAAALSVFVRLRHAVGVERQQIKWFAYSAAIFAIGVVLIVISLAIDTPLWFERAALAYSTVAGEAVPIAIGIAILRYRLYDIDIIINRLHRRALPVLYWGHDHQETGPPQRRRRRPCSRYRFLFRARFGAGG